MPFAMALINFMAQIQFEFGAIGLLKRQGQRVGIRRPLIVTDRGVKSAGTIDTVLDAFGQTASRAATVTLNDVTPPNPNESAVREAVGAHKQGDCDGIVAVGGGSSIDLAKGVAICATHDDPLQRLAVSEGGADRMTSRAATVIAVPTTAGNGSDVGRAAEAELGRSVPAMTQRLGLPTGLAERGVPRAMFRDIVRGALKNHSHQTHPRLAAVSDDKTMLETNL
jgi:alcohol dehydrogenase class IV